MELNVQKYLRSGKTLTDLETELGVKAHLSTLPAPHDGLVLLNYSQIDSPKTNPIVMECRGLILEKDTWDIVFMGYKRFFNYGEALELTGDFPFKSAVALEKVDGCCDENTILNTEDGPKTIKEICEQNYKGKVLGYNIDSQEQMMTAIKGISIKDNNNDWYEIELENGKIIKLTGNHYVWLPELQCYRQVKDLVGDEGVLLEK